MDKKLRFSPTVCITHNCNLNCVYCYQKHDCNSRMSFDTAKKVIDWIFQNVPSNMEEVEIGLIGGEPLLEFNLIKQMFEYVRQLNPPYPYLFYATTNGTLLTEEMKAWFTQNKKHFWLGLSLDGDRDTHNHNCSNSFDKIDIDFFRNNWNEQSIKMTLSDYSLKHLAHNIKFVHSLGFPISGVNEFEGDFDWDKDEYIKDLAGQLKELSAFYVENDTLELDQMLKLNLHYCERKPFERKKWCGIGDGAIFFDVDGQKYPCPFITPMTFSREQIFELQKTDYKNADNFIDEDCYNNCYIYPICRTCAGACYMTNGTFKKRIKSKCRTQKLIALFSADIQAKRIVKNPESQDKRTLRPTIDAIKKIREAYLDDFKNFL